MERNRIVGLLLAAIMIIGLAVWGIARSDDDTRNKDARAKIEDSGEASGQRPAARLGRERPDLRTELRAAVTGIVRDSEGKPIAGAQVCAWVSVNDLDGVPPGPAPCTRSEADGHYRLEGLFAARTTLNAEARGFIPQRWFGQHETWREDQLALTAGQTREGVDFSLRPGGAEVRGVVRDISGGVIESAFVWAGDGGFRDQGRSVARTDAEGRFSLWLGSPRIIEVHAEAEGYTEGTRRSAVPGPTVELFLAPESVIVGRVVLAGTDEPVSGVVIEADAEGFGNDSGGRARSDERGRFRIAKLEPGVYELEARGDELYGEAPELVHLGLAETREGVVIELHPAFMVSARVQLVGAAEPRPCPRGWVKLEDRVDKRNRHRGSIRDGEVVLRGLLAGSYAVEVQCEGAVSEPGYPDVVLDAASASGLVWEVHDGLAIRGEVVQSEGLPVTGVQVFAQMQADPDDPRKHMAQDVSDATGDDGRFVVSGLLPGSYELRVWSDRATEAEPVELTLEPGADLDGVQLEFAAEGTITGTVRDADGQLVANVQLVASPVGRRSRTVAVSDDEGRFVLEHLPPGESRITAMDGAAPLRAPGSTDDDEQGTLARVVGGETTEVEIVVENRKATVRGRVLDEHGSPLDDAFVSYQRQRESVTRGKNQGKVELRWQPDHQPVLTDTDGSFVLDGLAEGASYTLGAFRKGGGEAVVDDVHAGDAVELTIVDTGELAGSVVDAQDTPIERFKLTLRSDEGLTRAHEAFRTHGRFRMQELPPGRYTLVFESPAGVARLTNIELGSGERKEDLVVTLAPRVTVRGRLIDIDTREPIPGIGVEIGTRGASFSVGDEKAGASHISDAEGRFTVANAQTGKVTLSLMPRSSGEDARHNWQVFSYEIPAIEEVVDIGDIELVAQRLPSDRESGDIGFEVKQPDANAEPEDYIATVTLIRPGGPAEGSGLELGDRITTVDGHDVTGTHSARFHHLTRVAPGDSFTLGTADGKTVTITAGPAK